MSVVILDIPENGRVARFCLSDDGSVTVDDVPAVFPESMRALKAHSDLFVPFAPELVEDEWDRLVAKKIAEAAE